MAHKKTWAGRHFMPPFMASVNPPPPLTKKEKCVVIVEVVIALAIWLASGHAIEKIYTKAGFVDTPKFVFWIPALNLAFLIHLAFASWPQIKEEK